MNVPLTTNGGRLGTPPFLICIAPPDRGSCQSYLLYDARECHYEVFGNRLIEAIRGTDLSILIFHNDIPLHHTRGMIDKSHDQEERYQLEKECA